MKIELIVMFLFGAFCVYAPSALKPTPDVETVARVLYESMSTTPGYTKIIEWADWRADWDKETSICKEDWRIVAGVAIKTLK